MLEIIALVFPIAYIQTPNGNYSAGAYVIASYGGVAIYLALCAGILIWNWKQIHVKKKFAIGVALWVEFLVCGLQGAYPTWLISGMGITLMTLSFYLTLENPDILRAELTEQKMSMLYLKSQVNPHFLYNTLSSVSSLIKMNCTDEAFTMIHAIGMFYRTSLSDGKTLIPVEQEITNIENYIQIQKVRYGDKIDYEIQIDPEIYREWIVKLTLQPLVENSIYHGVKAMRKKGLIRIRGWKEGCLVYLQVSDNGAGIPEDKIDKLLLGDSGGKRYSYGLYNIQQRIQIYFGKEYGLHIESHEGAGTCTTICIPSGRNEK